IGLPATGTLGHRCIKRSTTPGHTRGRTGTGFCRGRPFERSGYFSWKEPTYENLSVHKGAGKTIPQPALAGTVRTCAIASQSRADDPGMTLRIHPLLFGASDPHKTLIVTENRAALALPGTENQR